MVFLGGHSAILATNYCVCSVRVCVCTRTASLVFIIAAHLGNTIIFYQLSPLILQATVNVCSATQTIEPPSVLDTVSIRETNL